MLTRRPHRLPAAAAVVAAVAVAVPWALASDETITVPGTGAVVKSQAPLRKGMELVVSGTATDQYGCVYDAFYMEECNPTTAPNQGHHQAHDQIIKTGAASDRGGPTKTLMTWLKFPYPDPQASHEYHMTIGTTLGRAKFCVAEQLDNCADGAKRGYNFQGNFTVTLVNADAPEPTTEPQTTTAPAPDPGKAATYPIPPPGAGANLLDGTLDFTDANGNPIDSPLGVALRFHVGHAQEICWIFLMTLPDEPKESYPGPSERFGACLSAVTKILIRHDQLTSQQGNPARAAAAKRCVVYGNAAARRLVRFTCSATAAGAHFTLKPRKRGARLSRLLKGKRSLIVRRSAHDKSGKATLKARWR